ncbi:MAG: hypothetical protein OXG54_00085 [Gammaproteobacteria bacterium]|nr:hypothetical protein [Gammaproteobacteria bacterium]
MGAPQRQVIEAIRDKVNNIDERFDGYRAELLEVIDEILRLEQQRPHNVVQQIQRRISALAELLVHNQESKS